MRETKRGPIVQGDCGSSILREYYSPMAGMHVAKDALRGETAAPSLVEALEKRLGRVHARQRLGIEQEFEARVFGHGTNFFHIENWRSGHALMRGVLKATGLSWIGRRNAANVRVRYNQVPAKNLPKAFSGYTILHISDLHVEISEDAMRRVETLIAPLDYDACVLTGDYRALTIGPYDETVERMGILCSRLKQPIYGVLGNHDTIRMVPALEDMGIRLLLNEADAIERDGEKIHVAGIDDAHYFRVDNMEKAADGIPLEDFSILLSHTPEVYRQAAHAGFDLMLSGHTHAGQICLPGQVPVKLNAVLPRRFGAGAWMHGMMHGYTSSGVGTSIVTARFNCPPEITLHRLECE